MTVFRGKGGAAELLSADFYAIKNRRESCEARADVELVMGLEPATCSLRIVNPDFHIFSQNAANRITKPFLGYILFTVFHVLTVIFT